MKRYSRIYVAGHKGLVGSSICRALHAKGFTNVITATSSELDLTNQNATENFFSAEKPEYVFMTAAKVGGILANNTYTGEFIYNNLMIGSNVVHAAYKFNVKKLLNIGSSCIYPKFAKQPLKEEYLLTGTLEPTNEAYALAKIAIIKLCRYYNQQYATNFISLMPSNQYGINDNFNMETAHVIPMLLRRFHLAKLLANKDFSNIKHNLFKYKLGFGLDNKINFQSNLSIEQALNAVGAYKDKVVVWGDGSPYREFMCSDDLADACLYFMQNKNYKDLGEFVNIGCGHDIQLKELFLLIKNIVGFKGEIVLDPTRPNGTPKKLLDTTNMELHGWKPKILLTEGIKKVYIEALCKD